MIDLQRPLRRANAEDAPALADFVNMAGEGLPICFWESMAEAGEDPWEVGRRRQAEKAAEGQVYVVDEGAGAIAAMTGYAISAEPEPVPDDFPAMFRPLQELENLAPSTWYVNVLAAYPEERGRGYGTMLLDLAQNIARDLGLPAMSIIVANQNIGARRLYERVGYAEVARRPIVKEGGWECDSDEWILLVKPL